MKGLMFTLLDQLATRAGCADEAWELVMEFAAAETLIDEGRHGFALQGQDALRLELFDVPAEAMLNCLCRDRSGFSDLGWEEGPPPSVRGDSCRGRDVNCEVFRKSLAPRPLPRLSSRSEAANDTEDELLDEKLEAEWNRYPPRSEPPGAKGR